MPYTSVNVKDTKRTPLKLKRGVKVPVEGQESNVDRLEIPVVTKPTSVGLSTSVKPVMRQEVAKGPAVAFKSKTQPEPKPDTKPVVASNPKKTVINQDIKVNPKVTQAARTAARMEISGKPTDKPVTDMNFSNATKKYIKHTSGHAQEFSQEEADALQNNAKRLKADPHKFIPTKMVGGKQMYTLSSGRGHSETLVKR